ncbi:MAG: hypothetical protein ABSE07_06500 [Methanoregula sp.]|jgi:hypothetical protein
MGEKMARRNKDTKTCDGCGKSLEITDIWYPFFDGERCGGDILYLCGACAIERIMSSDKSDLLERLHDAEGEMDNPLSDSMINFHTRFPISPIHWLDYAIDEDREEVKETLFKYWGGIVRD